MFRLHADESDAATNAVWTAQNARGYDGAEASKHHLKILLGCV